MAISSISELNNVAGSTTQIQYNNSGVFGASSNLTFDGTDLAVGNAAPSSYIDSVHGVIVGDTGDATSEIVIANSTTGVGEINFTDTADTTNQGQILYDHTSNFMSFDTAATEAMRIESSGDLLMASGNNIKIGGGATILSIDATGDHTNANMSQGITINQGASDNSIIDLKSSDVAHGMTGLAVETDTYANFAKSSATEGGVTFSGFSEGSYGLTLGARATTENTTDTTSSQGNLSFSTSLKSGTSHTSHNSTANIFTIANFSTCRFVMKGDGTVHASDTSWADALDDMPDALAGRAYTTEMAEQHGGLLGGMQIHAPELVKRMEDAGIVTRAEKAGEGDVEGHRFLNLQKGIKFSWDMGFQNFTFLAEIAKVLTQEQRDALPQQMRAAFAQLDANKSKELLT